MAQLIRRGAKVDVRDSLGRTPLHHAARAFNDAATAALLAESRSELFIATPEGFTPLQLACHFFPDDVQLHTRAFAVVQQLLEQGAKGYTGTESLDICDYHDAQASVLESVPALIEKYIYASD